jgi:hypothetical protein
MDDPATLMTLTGLQAAGAERVAAANRVVIGSPTLRAGERYTGIVWSHLDAATMSLRARVRAEGVLVVSALGGLFAFDDPVPEYKLKMASRLGELGPLAKFWRGHLTNALCGLAAGRSVWDLLPEEHRKALDLERVPGAQQVRVEFHAATGNRAAGHAAKAAKGRFVRHILEATHPGIDSAAAFRWEGWRGEIAGPGLVIVRAPG